jgi:hypothetical protein
LILNVGNEQASFVIQEYIVGFPKHRFAAQASVTAVTDLSSTCKRGDYTRFALYFADDGITPFCDVNVSIGIYRQGVGHIKGGAPSWAAVAGIAGLSSPRH